MKTRARPEFTNVPLNTVDDCNHNTSVSMSTEAAIRESSTRELLRSAGAVFTSGIVSSGFSVLSNLTAARGLQVTQYGTLAIGLAFAAICGRLATFQTWQYVVAKHGQKASIPEDDRVVAFATSLDLVSTLAAVVLAATLITPLTKVLHLESDPWVFWIFLGSIPPITVSTHLGVLRSTGRFGTYALQRSIVAGTKALAVFGCVLLHLPFHYYAAAFVIPDLLGLIALCRYADVSPALSRLPRKLRATRDDWHFVLTTSFHATIKTTLRETDVLIVAAIAGAAATGYFRIAKQFGAAMHQLSDPLYQVFYPELAERAKLHPQRAAKFLVSFTRPMAVVSLALWLAIAGLAWWVVPTLLGDSYAPAVPAIILFTAGSAVSVAAFGLHPFLVSTGRPADSLRSQAAAASCYVVVLPLFTLAWGVAGAAVSQIIFYATWVVLMLRNVRRVIWQEV